MWPPQRSSIWPVPGHLTSGQPQQQPRVPQPCLPPYNGGPYQQPPLLPDPTNWQDLLLEQQFSHMSFRQPPPIFQQQPPRPQQAKTQQQPLVPSLNRQINTSSAVNTSNGIPSLLDIHVPRPPHLNNSYLRNIQPPPQTPYQPPQTQPQRPCMYPPMINTSVPPPRITVLQKPRVAQRPVPGNV